LRSPCSAVFRIETIFEHDLSVEGFANGNVFSRGTAHALSLDHHRNAPYENLFTDLDAGSPARLWRSGGDEDRGPPAGARETLWNVRYRGHAPPLPDWPQMNVIGVEGYSPTRPEDDIWVAVAGVPNLHEAQRRAKGR
jgi:hypothetical protein